MASAKISAQAPVQPSGQRNDAGAGAAATARPESPVLLARDQPQPAIDLTPLRLLALRSLLSLLDQIVEPKTLLLDSALAGPLGLVCDVGSLRAHGVERMFWLEEPKELPDGVEEQDRMKTLTKDVNAPTKAVVYVCRPTLSLVRVIAGHILHDRSTAANVNSLAHTYHALFSPRRNELALQLLSNISTPSVMSNLNLYDLGLELIPLEQDVLSLEEEKSWADIWARGDHGVIHRAAMALMTIQHVYGTFPRIVGKGDMAQRLCSLLMRQRREYLASDPTNPTLQSPSKSIDSLIIIDRSVDLATPLCTQLTYEGLVDEVVGIRSAHVEVDASLASDGQNAQSSSTPSASASTTPLSNLASRKMKKVRLDRSTDPLFGSIRDENFAIVGERLHTSAKQLNEDYERRHNAKTVSEMREFVSKLGGLTKAHSSLRLHTGLTERIMAFTTQEIFNASLELQQNIIAGVNLNDQLASIEDLIAAQAPMMIILRLLCLLSVVSGGIKPKNLEYIKREVVQTYGYEQLPLLEMLTKTGLLTRATPSSARSTVGFQAARGPLQLVVDEVDERNPNDVSYVYSGYAPLSVRLVQAVTQKDALLARPSLTTSAALQSSAQTAVQRLSQNIPKAHPILGWRGFDDVVRSLPGATFDEIQGRDERGRDGASHAESALAAPAVGTASAASHNATTTTMVFFLGGVTFAEISAIRFMATQTRNRRFLIATTNTTSGDEMIKSLQ